MLIQIHCFTSATSVFNYGDLRPLEPIILTLLIFVIQLGKINTWISLMCK